MQLTIKQHHITETQIEAKFPYFIKSNLSQKYIAYLTPNYCVVINTNINTIYAQKCTDNDLQMELNSGAKVSDAHEFTEAFDKCQEAIEKIATECTKIFDSVNMTESEYNEKWYPKQEEVDHE